MVFRTCVCSFTNAFKLCYFGEEKLFVRCVDHVNLYHCDISTFMKPFFEYSQKYPVVVFVFSKVIWKEETSHILVFENGKTTCIASSIEEGANCRKIYKKTGLCVGNDFLNPLNANLFLEGAEMLAAFSDTELDREWVKRMYGYKNMYSVPVLLGCKNGFFLIDKKILFLENDKNHLIKKEDRETKFKKGYLSVYVIE